MLTGYLAYCGLISNEEGIFDAYMESRLRMFGYPLHPPQLSIPLPSPTGHPTFQLVNAPPGLVATLSEAAQLLVEMQRQFPRKTWTILQYSFPDASNEINWGRNL